MKWIHMLLVGINYKMNYEISILSISLGWMSSKTGLSTTEDRTSMIPYTLLDPIIINIKNLAVIDIIFATKYDDKKFE